MLERFLCYVSCILIISSSTKVFPCSVFPHILGKHQIGAYRALQKFLNRTILLGLKSGLEITGERGTFEKEKR